MAHPFTVSPLLYLPPWSRAVLRLSALLSMLLLLSNLTVRADSGLYKDFVILQAGSSTTYYRTYSGIAVPNAAFQNADLGTFNASASGLLLNGAEANTYDGNGAVIQAARLYYRVYESGTVPGSFVPVELSYRYSGIDGGPNNKKWDRTNAGIDLLQAAGRTGRFVLEVYFQADVSYAGNTFKNYDSNNAANYRATFTVGQATQLATVPAYALVDTTFQGKLHHIFGRLETNRITTGLLYDYAIDFANLKNYNGSLLEDSTLMSPGVYSDLYTTLYTSRANDNAAGMRHPSLHDSLRYMSRSQKVITLSGLLFNYNAIDPQARTNGTIQTVNEQLLDQYKSGVWQNPYQTLTMLAISPSTTTYNLTSCQVKLPSSLFLTNIGNQISTIAFDAGDGRGYQLIQPDAPVSLSYDSVGLKHWMFRVTLTTGQQLYSHCKIYFNNTSDNYSNANATAPGSTARGISPDKLITITATEAYLGKYGVADLVISYRDVNDKVLRKPLIVAEGFDPGHILSPEEPEGENTFKTFMTGVSNSGSDYLKNLLYTDPGKYDIVYVNWRNGTDYLQRNALALEAVIRWVNANKQPLLGVSQGNVVLGSSMGGVIARMALGRMDRAGGVAAHQTRLYVSLDAPHQGANVPLGYQAAVRHGARIYIGVGVLSHGVIPAVVEAVQFIRNGASPLQSLFLVDQPAAQQMLINRLNIIDQLTNTAHENFQQELKNNWAYPVNIRNVAISDGSECAIDQEFAQGSTMLYVYRSIKTRFLSDLIGMAAAAGLGAIGINIPIVTPALLIPGSSQVRATLEIKAAATYGDNRVYYGDVKYTKKILWLVPVTITVANHSYNAPTSLLPLDTYPGGFYYLPTGKQPGGASQDWAFTYDNTFSVQHRFCFVPTASALDIGQGNVTLSANDYLNRYVGASPPAAPLNSPFVNFTTAFRQDFATYLFNNDKYKLMNNELHEGLFLRSSNWLAEELEGNTSVRTNCVASCGNVTHTIQGNALVCNTADFQITNLPAGTSVTWSIPANASSAFQLQPDVPGLGQVRLTNQKTGIVNTTLTATINSGTNVINGSSNSIPIGCGDVTLTIPISNDNRGTFPYSQVACTFYNVSHPAETGIAGGGNATFVHQGCRVYVNLGAVPRTVTVASGGQPTTWGTSSYPYANTLYFELPIGSGGVPFTFNLGASGDCGAQSILFFSDSNNSLTAPTYSYEAAPNPVVDDGITIMAKRNPDKPKIASKEKETPLSYTVEVYDVSTGQLKFVEKNIEGNPQSRLKTSGLRPGYYLLHITDGETSKVIRIYKE